MVILNLLAIVKMLNVFPLFVITELDQDIITTFTHDDDDIRADNHYERTGQYNGIVHLPARDGRIPSFLCLRFACPTITKGNER